MTADQVAGDYGEVGMQLKGGIDHTSEFGFTEKRAEMNVAELEDAQTVEVVRQAGKRDIDLADAKIGAHRRVRRIPRQQRARR